MGIRGSIVAPDISALQVILIKHTEEIPGLTDEVLPRQWGPKRASNIRKLFGLKKTDDVRKFVVKHKKPNGQMRGPKIQRLVTPERISRKRRLRQWVVKKRQAWVKEREAWKVLKADYDEEKRAKVHAEIKKRKEKKEQQAMLKKKKKTA